MVRRLNEQQATINANMRGGEGEVRLEALLSADELYDKGRIFSRAIIKPGCSVGYHVHENEMEAYVIISGSGDYNDNGTAVKVSAGDVTLTKSGEGHGMVNNGDETLVMIALILHKDCRCG